MLLEDQLVTSIVLQYTIVVYTVYIFHRSKGTVMCLWWQLHTRAMGECWSCYINTGHKIWYVYIFYLFDTQPHLKIHNVHTQGCGNIEPTIRHFDPLLSCSSYTLYTAQFQFTALDVSDNVLHDWLFPHHCTYLHCMSVLNFMIYLWMCTL